MYLEHQPCGGYEVNTTQMLQKIEKPFGIHHPWVASAVATPKQGD
jgi:hypothetical protein